MPGPNYKNYNYNKMNYKNLLIKALLWGFFLFLSFCNPSVQNNKESLLLLLLNNQNISNNNNQSLCEINFSLQNTSLFNKIIEAPGATYSGFKDPNKAINGICGAGKTSGSTDVYSLQSSSNSTYCKQNEKCLVLEIENKKILDGPGIDIVVFENPFCYGGENNCNNARFMEPVILEVSYDGNNWCGWNPQYIGSDTSLTNLRKPMNWQRFAGIEPVLFNQKNWQYSENDIFDPSKAGGDGFDLGDSNFGQSGEGCNSTIKNQILTNGFIYLRLTSAVSRGFIYDSSSFDQTADIDGVIARYITNR
ncbi:MAG: hypothetical protein KatS3mg129_2192 [Leptospiraceae bacterium]|nr:MAG: hypothetical protein KatS3mg129_2192 [Leptospiraceae bacterium]